MQKSTPERGEIFMARAKKNSNWGCLVIIIFLCISLVVSFITSIQEDMQNSKDKELNETMSVLADPTSVAVTGDKVICYYKDLSKQTEGTFSDRYVPEDCLASTPEEARYILYCSKGATLVGTYSGGGGGGFRRVVNIEILDRTTNTIIGTNEFTGSNPPSSVKDSGNHYGSEPSMEKIHEWILSVIRDNATRAPADSASHDTITVYAQVPSGWSGPGCWVWSSETGEDAFEAWPGKSMIYDDGWYVISVPSWINYVIINANNGSSQTADLPVESGKDVWVVVKDSGGQAQVYYQEP
jgi:preprotein translocase subunit SecG